MRLIAKKPCSFGEQQFYIGDEIPKNFVADAKRQEEYGVITIVNDSEGGSGAQSDSLFTQEQVEKMLTEAVEEAVNNTIMEMEQEQKELQEKLLQGVVELEGNELGELTVLLDVFRGSDGESGQHITIAANSEEIRHVFSIMQLNADEGVKAIADIKSENVLILLHAADSRKTIKDAAKKQADKLFSLGGVQNESSNGKETTGANTEGADT